MEITGPVDRKMIINALNSGAKVFMADFEDSNTPTWNNLIDGQINLRDAIRRTITYADPSTGKQYKLNDKTAVLFVRARGWHLEERHMRVDGEPMSGSIFDFGLYFFHNAKELLARGSGPYFYLPKMESHLEARLWNDIFIRAQEKMGLPQGKIKATVLIETILASFEMDEILYELREHSAGLNCGRWDYIFSFIKKFSNDPHAVLPDRGQVTMATHFMRSYSKLAIKTAQQTVEQLLVSAQTDDGAVLDEKTIDRLFRVPANVNAELGLAPPEAELAALETAGRARLLKEAEDANARFLMAETDKLDAYADDLEKAAEVQIKALEAEIKAQKKALRGATGLTVGEKVEAQRAIKKLETRRDELMFATFERKKEIQREMEQILDSVQASLRLVPSFDGLFTVRWEVLA